MDAPADRRRHGVSLAWWVEQGTGGRASLAVLRATATDGSQFRYLTRKRRFATPQIVHPSLRLMACLDALTGGTVNLEFAPGSGVASQGHLWHICLHSIPPDLVARLPWLPDCLDSRWIRLKAVRGDGIP